MSKTTSMLRWMDSDIIRFVLVGVGLYVLWYILYDLWLLPDGRLDRLLSIHIIDIASDILQALGYTVFWHYRTIGLVGTAGVELVDGCSGIAASGLFAIFIAAYPGHWILRISYCIIGVVILYLTNIIRIVVLVITQEQWPAVFDITHDYSTTGVFYLVIFMLWVVWVRIAD